MAEDRGISHHLPNHHGTPLMGNVPIAVFYHVLEYLRATMRSTESVLGFPKEANFAVGRTVPDYETRMLNNVMSRVHREFTTFAQGTLRSRLFISNWRSLKPLLDLGLCGPQVRELSFYYNSRDDIDDDLFMRPKARLDNTKANLQQMISKLSNLHALHLTFDHENVAMSEFRAANFLDVIPINSTLQALHIQLDWTRESLTRLCEVVSESKSLSVLSILGMYEDDEETTAPNVPLMTKSPPASLKRLLLSLRGNLSDIHRWFLRPRNGFALRELRLHLWGFDGAALASSLSDACPLLLELSLEFQLLCSKSGSVVQAMEDAAAGVVVRCSSLQHLWLNMSPTFPLPRTLKSLHQIQNMAIDQTTYRDPRQSDKARDNELKTYLQTQLLSGELPNLLGVYLPVWKIFTRNGECLLSATKEFCEGQGIDFQTGSTSAPYTWDRDISLKD